MEVISFAIFGNENIFQGVQIYVFDR